MENIELEHTRLRITKEPAGTCQVRLTVEVPEEQVAQEMQQVARRIAREAHIPGFRKGKAPYGIIVQRLGEEAIRLEAADELAKPVYREALRRMEITPYAPGSLTEMELNPLRFTFTVSLPPVVELGDYRSLRIRPPEVRVSKEEIQEALERLREENAVLEPVEGRVARAGDVLTIAVKGQTDDGEPLVEEEEMEILLDPQDESPIPGFRRALEGMTVGEERTFRLPLPDEDPSKEGEFTVRLLSLFERILPNIDDDLARAVGNFKDLKALRAEIEKQLQEQKQEKAEEEYVEQVIQAAVEQARVEYPPEMLEAELDTLVGQVERWIRREARMSLSDYLKATGTDEEQLRESLRPRAEKRLRSALVLSEVVEAEGLTVSPGELKERIAEISQSWSDPADKVYKRLEEQAERLQAEILTQKAIERLLAIARGEVKSEER